MSRRIRTATATLAVALTAALVPVSTAGAAPAALPLLAGAPAERGPAPRPPQALTANVLPLAATALPSRSVAAAR
jgi:hypothetical protein